MTFSFSPLAHLADRYNAYITVTSGGRCAIYSGDIQNSLFEDMQYVL